MATKSGRSKLLAKLMVGLVLLAMPTGCQLNPMPGNLLPSFAAAREDRRIAEHAAQSKFPSPADVGLALNDQRTVE